MKAETVKTLVTLGLFILGFSLIDTASTAWGIFLILWANNIEARDREATSKAVSAFIAKLRNK